MRSRAALIAWVCACLAAGAASAAQSNLATLLRVTVDGVKAGGGTLRVALHDEATFSEARAMPLREQFVPNITGDAAVQFERLPPGEYAVRAYQDLNNDGKWEPGEPQAVSNGGAQIDFDHASIVLMPGTNMTTLHLK